jgi:O-antigen ligase
MLNKGKEFYYNLAGISFIIGLFVQDFFKIPLTIGIIIFGLTWIFSFDYQEKLKQLKRSPIALSFLVFYILHLISILYTEDLSAGWNDIRLKLTLLIFPFFFLTTTSISLKIRERLLALFVFLCLGMAGIDLMISTSEYLSTGDSSVFYYKNLVHLLKGKPHYSSWYYLFAIFVAFYQATRSHHKRYLWLLASVFLVVNLILLSSRIHLLALVIVFIIALVKYLSKRQMTSRYWLRITLVGSLFIGTLYLIPNTRSRIQDSVVELNKLLGAEDHRQTNPRVYIWKYAAEIIAEAPVMGYGVGDAKHKLQLALLDCDAKFWDGEKNVPLHHKSLNYHNQFMQSWAEIGLLGFLLLAFIMILPFTEKGHHPLLLIFVGISLFGFLTESVFERQAGVVFFAFMYPFLYGLQQKAPKKVD